MTFEVVVGMTCMAIAPFSPQRSINRCNTLFSTFDTSIRQFGWPQRQ